MAEDQQPVHLHVQSVGGDHHDHCRNQTAKTFKKERRCGKQQGAGDAQAQYRDHAAAAGGDDAGLSGGQELFFAKQAKGQSKESEQQRIWHGPPPDLPGLRQLLPADRMAGHDQGSEQQADPGYRDDGEWGGANSVERDLVDIGPAQHRGVDRHHDQNSGPGDHDGCCEPDGFGEMPG
jgi:hypothetical protein